MKCCTSIASCIKVTLALLNLWVLCVILVVVLGHWRVFDTELSLKTYNGPHLVIRRELKAEDTPKPKPVSFMSSNKTDIGTQQPVKEKKISVTTKMQTVLKPNPPTLNAVQQEIEERVNTMKQWCAKLSPRSVDIAAIPADRLSMILVDRDRRLLFCQIPGVAQNDWRRIFIYLTGKVNVTGHLKISAYDAHSKYGHLLKKLSDFRPAERKKIIEESQKIIFVRDPFERLVSTYQNKFTAQYSKYFHQTFGRQIIKRYRKNATAKALNDGSDVTFNEFVRFVVDSEHESGALLNEHWERYYKQCHPCIIKYDAIGKFETLVDDTKEILSKARVLAKLRPPYVADTFRNSDKTLKSLYQTVSATDLKRLWKIYYPDYNLFSYPFPDVLKKIFSSFFDY